MVCGSMPPKGGSLGKNNGVLCFKLNKIKMLKIEMQFGTFIALKSGEKLQPYNSCLFSHAGQAPHFFYLMES